MLDVALGKILYDLIWLVILVIFFAVGFFITAFKKDEK